MTRGKLVVWFAGIKRVNMVCVLFGGQVFRKRRPSEKSPLLQSSTLLRTLLHTLKRVEYVRYMRSVGTSSPLSGRKLNMQTLKYHASPRYTE